MKKHWANYLPSMNAASRTGRMITDIENRMATKEALLKQIEHLDFEIGFLDCQISADVRSDWDAGEI